MTNKRIPDLTAATTPLAGTELVPLWDGTGTKQVSVTNLTAGRAVAGTQFTASTGNFVPATSGKGVDFSAVTPAAGMTSKVLTNYEEGTWTPTVIALTGVITSYTSSGTYTRVGRQVIIVFDFTITANGTGAGIIAMQGLPFAVGTAYSAVGVCREIALAGVNGVVINTATATLNMQTTTNTYLGGTGARVVGTLCYTT